jgi:hypothetical protein
MLRDGGTKAYRSSCSIRYFCLIVTAIGFVGFEVFTAVIMKSIIFWDVTPRSPLSFKKK